MKNWFLYFGFAGSASGAWWAEYFGRTNAEKQLMAGLFFLVIIDFVSGSASAMKRGVAFSSQGQRKGIPKILIYLCVVGLAFVMPVVLKAVGAPVPPLPIPSAALGWLCFIEAHSILENITQVTGKKAEWLKRILEGSASSVDPSNKAPEVGAQDGTQ